MVGTIPVTANLSMQDLAATLTRNEQDFARLTVLAIDTRPGNTQNLATFVNDDDQLGALAIVAKGAASQGIQILSTTAYISGAKTDIDVYRLPVGN